MPHKRNNPGCPCCCPTCLLFDVSSGWSADEDNWTDDSGTWTFSTNLTTTSNNARTLRESGSGVADFIQYGWASTFYPKLSYLGTSTFYFYFFWKNASNHLYVKVDVTNSSDPSGLGRPDQIHWELREVIAGVDSLLVQKTATAVISDRLRFTLCLSGDDININGYSELGSLVWYEASCSNGAAIGTEQGFGTGDLNGETLTVYQSGASKQETYCPCLTNKCQNGTSPTQLQVTISGVTDDECSACDYLNGTFMLDRVLSQSLSSVGGFSVDDNYDAWFYEIENFCEIGSLYVVVDVYYAGGTPKLQFAVLPPNTSNPFTAYTEFDLDLPLTCDTCNCEEALDGLQVSLSGKLKMWMADPGRCDLDGATAEIAVVP